MSRRGRSRRQPAPLLLTPRAMLLRAGPRGCVLALGALSSLASVSLAVWAASGFRTPWCTASRACARRGESRQALETQQWSKATPHHAATEEPGAYTSRCAPHCLCEPIRQLLKGTPDKDTQEKTRGRWQRRRVCLAAAGLDGTPLLLDETPLLLAGSADACVWGQLCLGRAKPSS